MNCLKSLIMAAVGLAATSVAFSDFRVESHTESGAPIYVKDDIDRRSVVSATPDDLNDYGDDFRWPAQAATPDDGDVAQSTLPTKAQ